MAATGQNFTVYRGEDKTAEVTIAGSGSIAGWTFVASVRRSNRELDVVPPIITKTSGNGVTIADAANRVVHIELGEDDTLLFDDGVEKRKYPWDLKRTNVGAKGPLTVGEITVINSASR